MRARGFSPEAAQKQFSASEDWRKKHNVAQVYISTKPEDLEYSRRFYPCWTGRRDKVLQSYPLIFRLSLPESSILAWSTSLCLPISFLRTFTTRAWCHSIRNKISSNVSYLAASMNSTRHSFIINSVALYEYMTRFTFPLCSHLPHATSPTPISSTTTVIDLGDVSLSSLWQLRHHLQEASKLSTANYPETLHHVAIVNSPSFFPVIWRWIKVGNAVSLC